MERIDDLNIKGRKIIQNTDYFLFGMDSVILSNTVKLKKHDIMLDFCTGSAVIPVIVDAKCECEKIIGIELQKEMYELAKKNIKLNKLEERINVINADISDVKYIREQINKLCGTNTVSAITCNPPYKEVGTGLNTKCSVKDIAKNEVKCNLETVFKSASALLKTKGKLYMVHKPERIVDLICIARKYNMELKVLRTLQPTRTKKASIVLLEYVKNGGNECKIEPTIIEYNDNLTYTQEILDMYKSEDSL